MKLREILIFAGTTEGRKLSECLAASGIAHTLCVATEYGEIVLNEHPLTKIHRGRMNSEEIKEFIQNGNFMAVVDATHPYADVITENIKTAMQGMKVPYLRLKREQDEPKEQESVVYFNTSEDCAKALEKTEGNILLTTGSKELEKYCISDNVKKRFYVRVLPSKESLSLCMEKGIQGKHIIAMQGPFSIEMNKAIIDQYDISCLVTKESGSAGGYQEKLQAAKQADIPVFVIGHKKEEDGYSFTEICKELENLSGQSIKIGGQMEIVLAGIGMGAKSSLTKEVQEVIEDADILLGAKRMLIPYKPKLEKRPYYQAKKILPYLKEIQKKNQFMENRKVVILFSGDSGFYSGCQSLYHALRKEVKAGQLTATIRIMPGISSIAYLASYIGESYHDAEICSMHGKELCNLAHKIKNTYKTYLLMSGVKDVNQIGKILIDANMSECEVVAGYQLSYPEQQIRKMTPKECCEVKKEGLYTCFIKNPYFIPKKLTHGMADCVFIRNKVPITKEEVREISICKMQLYEGAVVYDIGSGTGSIAVEMAGLSDTIKVYAIEQKKEAISLIKQNKEKFQLKNITVIEKTAPEGLTELPVATHAFIGGSGGRMKEILNTLYLINPNMRVVVNAISIETICEMKEMLSLYKMEVEDIVQVQISRAKKVGSYHLMQAENPVWICVFQFCE